MFDRSDLGLGAETLGLHGEIWGLSIKTWIAGLLTLLIVASAHLGLRWWLRRSRAAEAARMDGGPSDFTGRVTTDAKESPATRHWIVHGLDRALPPLALLIWIQGVHFVAALLLTDQSTSGFITEMRNLLHTLRGIATLLALVWLLARIGGTIDELFRSLSARSTQVWDDALAPFAGRAARLLLPMMAIILGAPALTTTPGAQTIVQNGVSLLLIGTLTVLALQFLNALSTLVLQRHQIDVSDNREARAIHTQVTVLRKIISVLIGILALASMLMVFESVRRFGTAIIASAGVAGIIIGFAAQKSIATLLAGFQIALTQPIRIDDVVIVENEWGRIEEITLTYVVVRVWDLRRLILPITYFIEQPFQNWTRQSADILGTVFLHVDYSVPMSELRAELQRILDASPLWDRKVCVLQVTDAKERTLEIRALASARDASAAWDLRCEIREKLVTYLQQNHPQSLPTLRAAVDMKSLSARAGL